jgi:hypothetical protein
VHYSLHSSGSQQRLHPKRSTTSTRVTLIVD